jgi:hypothetical protein
MPDGTGRFDLGVVESPQMTDQGSDEEALRRLVRYFCRGLSVQQVLFAVSDRCDNDAAGKQQLDAILAEL